jgi:hypothetical protein
MYMVIRLPNNPATMMQFMFLEDTGSSIMSMYPQDIWHLQARPGGGAAVPPPLLGATRVRGIEGGSGQLRETRAVEVNMAADGTGEMMCPWDWAPVTLNDPTGVYQPAPRLSGPWVRYKLYTGSAPGGLGKTWAFDQKGGWNGIPVPRARMKDRRRPYHHAQYPGPNNAIKAFQAAGKTAPIYGAPLAILPATPYVGRPPGPPKRPPPGVRVGPNPPLSRQPPLQQLPPTLKIAGPGGGAGS